ncbi:MAG: hypothetical protein D6711_05845 [Chloroflexi bacterium]|nr:MAG: hypothetical protein D6711_05845 [Chloroflexota bacterium]
MTNIKKRLAQIERRIANIKEELASIGEMRPGSLTKQYKDPQRQTGAYYQLSYTLDMKSRTEYIRKEFVNDIRRQISNYKRYKKLNAQWVALSIEHSKLTMKLKQTP